MKEMLILICLLLFVVASRAQTNYEEAISQGDSLRNIGKYDLAINKYFAAEAFDPLQKKEVKFKIDSVFDKIDSVKKEAINQRTLAKEATGIAEKARDSARRSDSITKIEKANSYKYTLANAPYKYVRLIRDGPTDEAKIKKDTFQLKLIAYCNHLDMLQNYLDTMADQKNAYADLREKLYYNNDLYEKIYYCFKSIDAKDDSILRRDDSSGNHSFESKTFKEEKSTVSLSNGVVTVLGDNNKKDTIHLFPAGQKITGFALSDKLKLIFCATDDNYIVVYNLKDLQNLKPDKIEMGIKVTAIDFDDDSKILYFGTVKGDVGFINYTEDKKNQPVYDAENALGSKATAIDVFEYENNTFLLATGQNGKAVVYRIDSNFLVPGNKFSGNILPDQDLGSIDNAAFDSSRGQVVLEASKAGNPAVYLWDPFTESVLRKYKNKMQFKPPDIIIGEPGFATIWKETKFY